MRDAFHGVCGTFVASDSILKYKDTRALTVTGRTACNGSHEFLSATSEFLYIVIIRLFLFISINLYFGYNDDST